MSKKAKASVPGSKAYTRAEKIEELFRRGVLVDWLGHSTQQEMYKAINDIKSKKVVVNCSRRLGKTWLLVAMALEYAIRNPRAEIKYASVNQKAARRIVFPIFRQILEQCPKHLQPVFRTHEGEYRFSNGSIITISGTEQGQIDSLRGQACDLALIDEAGFMDDLEYVIGSVIEPQTLTRPNAKIIIVSTPPVTPDHSFVRKYMEQAMANGSYIHRTIYHNPMLTPETIEEYMKEAGGAESTTWRREYLAEVVTETDSALFPEALNSDALNRIVLDVERPEFFVPFTAVDLGYMDNHGVLFGYYHFVLGKPVIEDEILINKCTSEILVQKILERERELWGDVRPTRRVVDGNALQIADLNSTHHFTCNVPAKSDLPANVNRVRMTLANEQVIIAPRARNLLTQLKFATWDKTKTKFSRSSDGGHWDLAAAFMYWIKHVDTTTNPFPPGYGWDAYTSWGVPKKHPSSLNESLKKLVPRLRKKISH